MNPIREQLNIGLPALTLILIWVILLVVKGLPLTINWEAMKVIPDTIAVYVLLHFLFVKWLWRMRAFRNWLVTVPDLQGTWRGKLETTWIDPESGKTPTSIEAYVVVRQTLRSVSIVVFTRESISMSESASLSLGKDDGVRVLSFTYCNQPVATVRKRSEMHFGAARLRLSLTPSMNLEGDYWTDRKTTGHLRLTYDSHRLLESFPESDH